jgi:hypothetical protein
LAAFALFPWCLCFRNGNTFFRSKTKSNSSSLYSIVLSLLPRFLTFLRFFFEW